MQMLWNNIHEYMTFILYLAEMTPISTWRRSHAPVCTYNALP